jgi:excinuclease UvrABC ATPase subunit
VKSKGQSGAEVLDMTVEDGTKLLEVLHALVDQGNSMVVIEHNLEVIKTAD